MIEEKILEMQKIKEEIMENIRKELISRIEFQIDLLYDSCEEFAMHFTRIERDLEFIRCELNNLFEKLYYIRDKLGV